MITSTYTVRYVRMKDSKLCQFLKAYLNLNHKYKNIEQNCTANTNTMKLVQDTSQICAILSEYSLNISTGTGPLFFQ